MLSHDQLSELRHFLNRLQNREVRVERSSRLNNAFRISYKVIVQAGSDTYSFISDSGEVSVFLDPNEAEAFSSDSSSITLMYGDDLITIRHARMR